MYIFININTYQLLCMHMNKLEPYYILFLMTWSTSRDQMFHHFPWTLSQQLKTSTTISESTLLLYETSKEIRQFSTSVLHSTLLSSSPVIIRKIWFVHYKLKSVWYLRVHTRKGKGKCVSPEGWECGWLVLWMSVWGGGNSKCSVNEVGNNRGLSSVT